MKKLLLLAFLTLLCFFTGYTQMSIDASISFQNDPAKGYSLYIPSGYDQNTVNPAMLALHPLNTRRWNAQSWRDTLITFAEANGLMLICPDGGPDGRIDDPIDTAFTSFLLDSMERAYRLDTDAIYVMGFSWGARTTYTYGLRNIDRFAGLMPIGAAINGLAEVGSLTEQGQDHNVFIIHGRNDSPNSRFFPVRDALIDAEACVYDTLMNGVGHTIDFPGRNNLLSMGYDYLRDNRCGMTTSSKTVKDEVWNLRNPMAAGSRISIPENIRLTGIWNLDGQRMDVSDPLVFDKSGIYLVHYKSKWGRVGMAKVVVTSR